MKLQLQFLHTCSFELNIVAMDFDLISDLHIDQWPDDQELNFKGLGTSLNCVVAGDVSQSLFKTRDFLYKLADHYKQVVFVDGNHEHKPDYSDITRNCEWLERELNKKRNVTYLWDSTCVFESTAIVGTNGWWTFDYCDPIISRLEQIDKFCEKELHHQSTAVGIWDEAVENSEFLCNVVGEFNKTDIIEDIIVITHTMPRRDLVIPAAYMDTCDLAKMYNSQLSEVFNADVNNKIKTWCFGHYHAEAVDKEIDGVRYVSNPRGRPDDTVFPVYYPKLVTL